MMEAVALEHRQRPKRHDRASTRLGAQVETVGRDVKELGRLAAENAKATLHDVRDRGERLYGRMRTKSRRAVERRPLVTLGVAAGLGALTALLLSRR